jgi:hypothetical protein
MSTTHHTRGPCAVSRCIAMALPDGEYCAVHQWVGHIRAALGKSVTSIIETGRLLIIAKEKLGHREWGRLFKTKLVPFGIRSAQYLMVIAQHPVLSDAKHASLLPSSWMTLYALSRANPATLTAALHDGRVRPDMPRKAVRALLPSRRPSPQPDSSPWAIDDLRKAIDKVLHTWPIEAQALAPQILRDIADTLEAQTPADTDSSVACHEREVTV